jgi:hypothetical protein
LTLLRVFKKMHRCFPRSFGICRDGGMTEEKIVSVSLFLSSLGRQKDHGDRFGEGFRCRQSSRFCQDDVRRVHPFGKIVGEPQHSYRKREVVLPGFERVSETFVAARHENQGNVFFHVPERVEDMTQGSCPEPSGQNKHGGFFWKSEIPPGFPGRFLPGKVGVYRNAEEMNPLCGDSHSRKFLTGVFRWNDIMVHMRMDPESMRKQIRQNGNDHGSGKRA